MGARGGVGRRWLGPLIGLGLGLGLVVTVIVSSWRSPRTRVLLVMPADADALTERLAGTVAQTLGVVASQPVEPVRVDAAESSGLAMLSALAEQRGAGLVVVLEADRLAPEHVTPEVMAALGEDGFWLEARDVGTWPSGADESVGSTLMLTAGATRLSRQYAAYELLRRLGVRFYHPEQSYVPVHDPADLRDLARRPTARTRAGPAHVPDFGHRSWSFHQPHPLEHLEAFSDPEHPIDEAVRVNDWIVANLGDGFRGAGRGVVSPEQRARRAAELEELRELLGFPRGTGISLHNLQQGASAEIDADADAPVREQIEALVAERLEATPDARTFGIHFGTTEFTTTPDEQTVQWLGWAAEAALSRRPEVRVEINDHITGGQPSPHFDDLGCPSGTNDEGRSDYYDLAFHTDPRVAVQVHTVMFYPLEGPARVYNQRSFAHKRCLMERASEQGRPIKWFPEGAWWLSFDNPVPMYLPLYLWTRARDIELLRPLLPRYGGTLYGHRMFNSGQEWGYWQQDYAVGMMAWNADVTLEQVLGELFDPLCEPWQWREGCDARREAIAVLQEVMDHQRELFLGREDYAGRPGGLYAYFAGEDDADAIAASSGFEFRPVRVPFSEVLGWDEAALEHFRRTDLAMLGEAAEAYAGWTARLRALEEQVPEDGRAWLAETLDGVEIDGLRAEQAELLYRAVLDLRGARLEGEPRPADAARGSLGEAARVMARAEEVIRRREAAYRYPPEQTHGGGLTPDTAVPNGTTYPYRVHTKTHLLTYWHNRHDEVSRILEGAEHAGLQLREAVDAPGAELAVTWPPDGLAGQVAVGEQVLEPGAERFELPEGEGVWTVTGPSSGVVVRSSMRATTPRKGLTLLEPDDRNARRVLRSVLPAIEWAWVSEPAALVFAPDPDGDGSVPHDALVVAAAVEDGAGSFSTAPVELPLPIALSSGGKRLTITVTDAVVRGRIVDGTLVGPLEIDAQLSVDDLASTAHDLAGFDRKGYIALISRIWGFDPTSPPKTVPIRAELSLGE